MEDDNKRNAQAGEPEHAPEGPAPERTPPAAESGPTTPDAGKKRQSGRGNLLPFGSKPKSEPKERPIDEVRVSDDALASIIGLAAHEVPGVVGMAPASITEGIRRILGVRQVDEGVVIEHHEADERADVDIHVVVAYGVNIPVVAESIRERVRYASKSLAGITLDEVRVHVAGISRG